MNKFDRLDGVAAPMDVSNVDTDQIIPARYLSRARQDGFGEQLFHDLRFDDDGSQRPGFVLNFPAYKGASMLVADDNFGCGSSRESAVWALMDFGIRVVIATSFGDIFYNNSFKNGLLAIVLPKDTTASLRGALKDAKGPRPRLSVDLPAQTVTAPDGKPIAFSIDPMRKELLLQGMDEITLTLKHAAEIAAFESNYDQDFSWLSNQQANK